MKDIIKSLLVRLVLWGLVIGGVVGLLLSRREGEAVEPEPPEVTVAKPVEKDVTEYYEFTGNTQSVEFVEIRARVEGFLDEVYFNDSDMVEKGELLFLIDPNEYKAKRDEAAAEVRAAEATLEGTQIDLERVEEAFKTNAVSEREVTTRRAQRDKAAAQLKGALAALNEAELKLGYTQVFSPVTGKASRRLVDIGNLVGAEEKTMLTTVVKMDPMYVYFDVSELIVLDVIGEKKGKIKKEEQRSFRMGLADEEGYSVEGVIDYVDNVVDPATGTISVRGVFGNKEHRVIPGMFVRVQVPARVAKNALLVKESAIGTDIAGKYLLVVGEGNVVEQRKVELGADFEDMRIVKEGIKAGEKYIVKGLLRARPGMPVKAASGGNE